MRATFLIITILLSVQNGSAQSEFVNSYAVKTTTYGGMADGGVTNGLSYTFEVKTDLTLPYVFLNGEPLELKKGEKVIFDASSYVPYQWTPEYEREAFDTTDSEVQKNFFATVSNGIYYVVIPYGGSWEYARKYRVGTKEYTATVKEGFDEIKSYAMP